MSELRYKRDHFKHINHEELSTKVILKCLTTKLVECFLSHITEKVQDNNLRFLKIARHLTNDAFSFLLSYANNNTTDQNTDGALLEFSLRTAIHRKSRVSSAIFVCDN